MQNRTLFRLLRETVDSHPDAVYMRERTPQGWRDATFRAIAGEARDVAGFLLSRGFAPQDRVSLLAEGRNSWIAAELGILLAGGISVPISVKIKEKGEILFRMKHSASRFAITSTMHAEKIASLAGDLPDLCAILSLDETLPAAVRMPAVSWTEVRATGAAWAAGHAAEMDGIEQRAREDDPVTLTYTSGTTAEPKGILLSHKNYYVNVENADGMFPLPPPLYMLLILPWDHSFGHTAGLFLFIRKASVIAAVEPAKTELGTIRNIPKNLKEIGPTYLLVVPALVENFRKNITAQVRQKGGLSAAMFFLAIGLGMRVNGDGFRMRHDPLSLLAWPLYLLLRSIVRGSVRTSLGGRIVFMVSGGSACSSDHVRWFSALGIPVYQGYGLSETSPIIASNTHVPGNFKIGSSGRPSSWAEVRIADDAGAELPRGETGEIWVRGECVMLGYWKNEKATREAITDGWFHTGDLGYVDADGFLFVVGRIKSLLVGTNGEKYSPEALEQHLVDTVPAFQQVMLYNQQDPYTVALVVPDPGNARALTGKDGQGVLTDADLDRALSAMRQALMRYRKDPVLSSQFVSTWTPRTFALVAEPFAEDNGMMNASMKVVRRAVVARYQERIRRLYGEEDDPLNDANREVLRLWLSPPRGQGQP